MSYMISEKCIACGSCEPECPNSAISEGETYFQIDPDKCCECVGTWKSPQCLTLCSVQAPQPDPDRKESRKQLLEKWKKMHPGETPAYV